MIAVSGSATVGGTLSGSVINGFVPSGQSIDIITGAIGQRQLRQPSSLPSGFNGAVVGSVLSPHQFRRGLFRSLLGWRRRDHKLGRRRQLEWRCAARRNDLVQLNLANGVTVNHASGNDIIRGLSSTASNHLVLSGGSLTLNDALTTSTLAGTLTLSGSGNLASSGILNAATLNISGGTLNGSGSLVVTSSFSQSAGIINIAGSVTITQAGGALSLGQITAGSIAATAQAGSLSTTAPLVSQSGAITLSGASGTMTLGDIIQASGSLTITNAGPITNSGTLSFGGIGVISAAAGTGTFTNNGTLRPGGAGTGTLNITGNFVQGPGGTLDMDVSSLIVYDKLVVTGTAVLGGTLLVNSTGYTPVNGDQFTLLSYTGLASGTFAAITAPVFSGATANYAFGSFIFSLPAGATNTWLIDGNGSWTVAGNWSLGVPVAGQDVVIPDYTTQFTITIPSGAQVVGSIVLQGNDILALNGGSLTLTRPSTINGTLAIGGGSLIANGNLGVNTFNLSGGAYNGSGNLTVTNVFSHTAGIFNTTGTVSITQATGNLTLTQSLATGALTINVPAGDLTIQDAIVNAAGTMDITVSGNLNVVAVAAPTQLNSTGLQTIGANGILVQGAAAGTDFSSAIVGGGGQNITAGAAGIVLNGGTGGFGNFADILVPNGSPGGQTITINGGGSLNLNGGSGQFNSAVIQSTGAGGQTITFTGAGSVLNVRGGSGGISSNFAEVASLTTQAIHFLAGGAINLTGGNIGTEADATIQALGSQTIDGNPDITLRGGSSGGSVNRGNFAGIGAFGAPTDVQTILAHNLTLLGGAGVESFAFIVGSPGGRQDLTATGAVILTGGSGIDAGAVIGNPGSFFLGLTGVNVTLNATGPITLTAGSGAVGAEGIGGSALIGAIGGFSANITINGQSGVTLSRGGSTTNTALIGSDTGGGTLIVKAGLGGAGTLAVNDGTLKTTGSIALTAPDIVISTGTVDAGTGGVVTIASTPGRTVSLGNGTTPNSLGLSNAELGQIHGGSLQIGTDTGGAIVVDGAVSVSGTGIAAVFLKGSSVQFDNDFGVVGGDLDIHVSGAVKLVAGTQVVPAPVQVRANNVTINAGSLALNGGTAAGAFATIDAGTGNVVVTVNGAVDLAGGGSSNSDAWIVATGNITITALSCNGCSTRLGSIALVPLGDTQTDTGLGANGTIIVKLLGGNEEQLVIQQTTIIAAVDNSRKDTVATTTAPVTPPPPVNVAGGTGGGGQPTLTEPGGTAGGEAGGFGSTDSGSASGGSAQGSPAQGGGRPQGTQRQRARANAGC